MRRVVVVAVAVAVEAERRRHQLLDLDAAQTASRVTLSPWISATCGALSVSQCVSAHVLEPFAPAPSLAVSPAAVDVSAVAEMAATRETVLLSVSTGWVWELQK